MSFRLIYFLQKFHFLHRSNNIRLAFRETASSMTAKFPLKPFSPKACILALIATIIVYLPFASLAYVAYVGYL
jgi:hypothetical protein